MPYSCSGFAFWWIFPLVFGSLWLLLVVFGLRRFRRLGSGSYAWAHTDAASILKERFARGEIDDAEYRRRLAVIQKAVLANRM